MNIDQLKEAVNHPPHYAVHPSGVECIELSELMEFRRGNAFKYIWRAGKKIDSVEDLKKAIWYIDRILNDSSDFRNETTIVSYFHEHFEKLMKVIRTEVDELKVEALSNLFFGKLVEAKEVVQKMIMKLQNTTTI